MIEWWSDLIQLCQIVWQLLQFSTLSWLLVSLAQSSAMLNIVDKMNLNGSAVEYWRGMEKTESMKLKVLSIFFVNFAFVHTCVGHNIFDTRF